MTCFVFRVSLLVSRCSTAISRFELLTTRYSVLATLLAVLLAGSAVGQVTPPTAAAATSRYERGKLFLSQGKYALAMNELQSLTIMGAVGTTQYTAPATYLWAAAALQADQAAVAEPVLGRLREKQPQWAGMPDVILLQAQLAERLGQPDRALELLNELPAGQLQAEKAALLTRLGGGAGKAVTPKPLTGPLRVSVLLPLSLDGDSETARRMLFAQELYAGLKLAADSLTEQGQAVELRVYDLGNDTLEARRLLQQGGALAADLIVGPVYKAPARLIARAAAARQVPIINPLSEDGALLAEAATLYLFRPSVQTQARMAAKLAYERFETKTAVLLVEETKDDAAFAVAFRAEYERLGGVVKAEEKVSSQTYRTRMTEKVNALPIDSAAMTGVLVVASEERNAAQQVVSRVEREVLTIPVIAPASWLELTELTLDQFANKEMYFLAPAWRPAGTPAEKRLRRAWRARYKVPPTDFGRAGFELLYAFGPLVRQYGAGLSTGLAERGIQPGPLLPGLGYPAGARDNQAVSVLKLTGRQVEVVK